MSHINSSTSQLRRAALSIISCIVLLAALPRSYGVEKTTVYVSIPPQKQLVEKIAGDFVETHILLPPGKSPETFSPTPREVAGLAGARALFVIGVPFEDELIPVIRKNMKNVRIVDTAAGIERHQIERHSQTDGSHCHAHPDPHIWLSLPLLKTQVSNIAYGLSAIDTENSGIYADNLKKLVAEIDELHDSTVKLLAPHKGKTFFVFHPSFGYFADDYGLEQKAIEAGGKSPTPKELAALIKTAKKHAAPVIFIQPQFDSRTANTIANSIGAKTAELDPLAEELMENIEKIAGDIVKSFGTTRDTQK